MAVRVETVGEVVTAYIEGDLDHHTAKEVRENIDAALERSAPSMLVLDFGGVSFMDSSGIGLVMGRYRQMKHYGGEIHIVNTSPHINKVMKLAGLDRLAVIDKTNLR